MITIDDLLKAELNCACDDSLDDESDIDEEYWNHRVILWQHGFRDIEKTKPYFEYGIHEVWYNEENEVVLWTEDAVEPFGETLDELKQSIDWMRAACEKPVLIETELEAACKKRETNKKIPDNMVVA